MLCALLETTLLVCWYKEVISIRKQVKRYTTSESSCETRSFEKVSRIFHKSILNNFIVQNFLYKTERPKGVRRSNENSVKKKLMQCRTLS